MREYETTFIVQPEISEEGREALLEKVGGILNRFGATRLEVEDHGKRKLAYEIRKFQKGHYLTLSFLDDGSAVSELEQALRYEESVLRYLTVQAKPEVEDIEARKKQAEERERLRRERAAERAAREAEERAAREAEEEARREAASQEDDEDESYGDADEDDDDRDASDDEDDDDRGPRRGRRS